MIPQMAVVLTDAHRKTLWVNDEFTQMTGYPLSEVHCSNPKQFLQEED